MSTTKLTKKAKKTIFLADYKTSMLAILNSNDTVHIGTNTYTQRHINNQTKLLSNEFKDIASRGQFYVLILELIINKLTLYIANKNCTEDNKKVARTYLHKAATLINNAEESEGE